MAGEPDTRLSEIPGRLRPWPADCQGPVNVERACVMKGREAKAKVTVPAITSVRGDASGSNAAFRAARTRGRFVLAEKLTTLAFRRSLFPPVHYSESSPLKITTGSLSGDPEILKKKTRMAHSRVCRSSQFNRAFWDRTAGLKAEQQV